MRLDEQQSQPLPIRQLIHLAQRLREDRDHAALPVLHRVEIVKRADAKHRRRQPFRFRRVFRCGFAIKYPVPHF
jgi:hypothetical protein